MEYMKKLYYVFIFLLVIVAIVFRYPPAFFITDLVNDNKKEILLQVDDKISAKKQSDLNVEIIDIHSGLSIYDAKYQPKITTVVQPNHIYQVLITDSKYSMIQEEPIFIKWDNDNHLYEMGASNFWKKNTTGCINIPLLLHKSGQLDSLPQIDLINTSGNQLQANFHIFDSSNHVIATYATNKQPQFDLNRLIANMEYKVRFSNISDNYNKPLDMLIKKTNDHQLIVKQNRHWSLLASRWTIMLPQKQSSAFKYRLTSLASLTNETLPTPQVINGGDIAPMNRLRIVDKIQGANIDILEEGPAVKATKKINQVNTTTGYKDSDTKFGRMPSTLYSSFHHEGDQVTNGQSEFSEIAVQFKGSDVNAANFITDANAGWNPSDLNLDTTNMWIKVKYSNAAYYDGELVDAVALIKITPFKNRTFDPNNSNYQYIATPNYTLSNPMNNWAMTKQPFYPTIQLSQLLYRGWVWQNVKEFQVDLQFYQKSGELINFEKGTMEDKKATYYTINSLNPEGKDVEEYNKFTRSPVHGPEFVYPYDISNAYKIVNSNIQTSYNGGTYAGTQHGYNGGSAPWGGTDDVLGSPTFSKNSVTMTTSNNSHIKMTLGNMLEDALGAKNNGQDVMRTNYMWATISTDAFTNNIVDYIDIPVQKKWVGTIPDLPDGIPVQIISQWLQDGKLMQEVEQTQYLTKENNWQVVFKQLPTEEDMIQILKKQASGATITDFKYSVKEITDGIDVLKDYDIQYAGDSSNFVITNTAKKTSLTVKKVWQENNVLIENNLTQNFSPVTVHLKRKIQNTLDSNFDQLIQLTYNEDSTKSWQAKVADLPINDSTNQAYIYFIEEDTKGIEPFYLKDYINNNITLSFNEDENKIEVINEKQTAKINIIKKWFDLYGNEIDNQDLPKIVEVDIYRTKDGSTTNGEFVQTVSINRQGDAAPFTWQTTEPIEVITKYANDGYYTYYLKEKSISGYLEISSDSEKQLTFNNQTPGEITFTLKNKVNPVYPQTGGKGVLGLIVIGVIILGVANIYRKLTTNLEEK